jgi:signal transduction histidine kinase
MIIAQRPPDEKSRLDSLYKYHILDTSAEQSFNEIVQLASCVCQTPIATVTLVDDNRQWFKAEVGFNGTKETPRDPAFCAHAILHEELMEVTNALRDERFHDNPLVEGAPKIRFYAGMPLTMADGSRLGTLCVIDRVPRHLTDDQKSCLRILAKRVVNLLELRLTVSELNQAMLTIKEQKAALQSLLQMNNRALHTIEEQKAVLQKTNEAGTRLLSVIGHDLKSPLATLITLMDSYALQDMTSGEFMEWVGKLRDNVDYAYNLLNDLLTWASEQFEGQVLARENLHLAAVIEGEFKNVRSLAEKKGNRLVNRVALDTVVNADPRALLFIIRNLLLNANKFTENGTITLEAQPQSDGQTRISVVDTGVGLTPQQLERMFDPATRCSTVGTQGEKGSGLGLRICQEFAQKHGGRLGAESTPGKGSRFYFTLGPGK